MLRIQQKLNETSKGIIQSRPLALKSYEGFSKTFENKIKTVHQNVLLLLKPSFDKIFIKILSYKHFENKSAFYNKDLPLALNPHHYL